MKELIGVLIFVLWILLKAFLTRKESAEAQERTPPSTAAYMRYAHLRNKCREISGQSPETVKNILLERLVRRLSPVQVKIHAAERINRPHGRTLHSVSLDEETKCWVRLGFEILEADANLVKKECLTFLLGEMDQAQAAYHATAQKRARTATAKPKTL